MGFLVAGDWKAEKREESKMRAALAVAREKFESAPMAGRLVVGPYVAPLIDLLGVLVEHVEALEKGAGRGK